jgi:hypothetical protein
MQKHYTAVTTNRTPRPRSKRLREQGIGSANSTVVLNAETGGSSVPSGDGHTHANKSALDQISTDENGYEWLTRLVENTVTDPNTGEESTEMQQVTEKVKAGYADMAHDLTPNSPVRQQFLSRLVDDVAAGNITFQQAIQVLGIAHFGGEAQFGTFVRSLYAGSGAGIDNLGNAEFESVRVRTYFEAVELIINRLSAIEGDQLLTEGDTIDRVVDLGDNCYGLYLHPKWEGYFTAISAGSVLKGIINNLGAMALGMTTGSQNAQLYTSWIRANSVNPSLNYIEVTMYPDDQTPAGQNFPPCELMKIARWGHQTDTTRQTCLYLSSTEGRIVKYVNVTKPIIDRTNYGATFGTLPDFVRLLTDSEGNPLPIRQGLDYMYIPGVITQDIIRIDWQGDPICEYVDRGEWSPYETYYFKAQNPVTGIYEISDVWYNGCKYRCCVNNTTYAPGWSVTDWAMIEGNPDFTVEFNETETLFDPDRFDLTLYIIAKIYNLDVTDDILVTDVIWTRYSEDQNGIERVASDNAWAVRRTAQGPIGKSIHLTVEDLDLNGYVPKKVRFTATVTLRDGMSREAAVESASFEY